MKKLFALIVTSLLVITLASCNNTTVDYTLHDTDNSELKVVQEWLSSKNIATQATPVVARESKAVAGYEVFLPIDMVAASRYVVVDLENNVYNGNNTGDNWHHSLFDSLSFTYLALYNSVNLTTVAEQLTNAETAITTAFSGVIAAKPFAAVNVVPNADLEEVTYVEGENRSLVIVYMPVLVEYYTAKEGGDAVKTLHTFALVPVYYEIAYTTDNTLLQDNALKTSFAQVNLATTGTLINDLAE